jgi:hypothetical protein
MALSSLVVTLNALRLARGNTTSVEPPLLDGAAAEVRA